MSRFAHPHYVLNSLLCLPVPFLLLGMLPPHPRISDGSDYATFIGYSMPIMAMPLILRRRAERFLETRLTVMFSFMKLYNLGALLCMQRWSFALAYFLVWFAVTTTFRRPRFLGSSRIVEFDASDLANEALLVPAGLPTPEQIAAAPPPELERLVKEAKEEHTRLRVLNEGKRVILMPWWARERSSHDVEILFALLSNRFTTSKLKFAMLDLQRFPALAPDLDVVPDQFGPRSGLPCLIMFADGKEVKRLPLLEGEEESDDGNTESDSLRRRKKPWEWTAESIIDGFDLESKGKVKAPTVLETPLVENDKPLNAHSTDALS